MNAICTTPDIDTLLAKNSPVAIGISGGKDSCAVAFATLAHLEAIGHRGQRILIHSDLGAVEWKDSAPTCARLAERLGIELMTVTRKAGGMMERWEGRWQANLERYVNLECVKLILPWSTASMRFCTAELKRDVICAALVKRFPNSTILSVSGIRRQESHKRAKAPIMKAQAKMTSRKWQTTGYEWNALLDWKLDEVFAYLDAKQFTLHEAYRTYKTSRVSCAFCILANKDDLEKSSSCPDNADIYRRMVDLEIASTFAFKQNAWLGDIRPAILTHQQLAGLAHAKRMAEVREHAEAELPEHLLYTAGWPTCVPTSAEAELIGRVRRTVAEAIGITVKYTDAGAIVARYQQLMAEHLEE
jgi:3'-phosphoadenosine 5'-phosphosulfate sulfotransferase (PAPS reductase)/FAD synthetase